MEKESMTEIEVLRARISQTKPDDAKLYFVTRILKDSALRRKAVLGKFIYKVYQIDIDDEIRGHLYSTTISELDRTIKKELSLIEYSPISDDTDSLFSYKLKGKEKTLAFSDVVINQLAKPCPKVQSIEGIISEDEELWAYCVGFEEENDEKIFTFRRILGSKIAIDEKAGKGLIKKVMQTLFNTKSKKLELLHGEVVALDKSVDCVYFDETFFVLKKVNFEQIVGIQEEFKEAAHNVVKDLEATGRIDGLEILAKKVDSGTSLHRKLARIARSGGIRTIDDKAVRAMKKIAKRHGEKDITSNGRLVLSEEADIEVLLKLVGDYYKIGEVSGKSYGTYSGKELKVEE